MPLSKSKIEELNKEIKVLSDKLHAKGTITHEQYESERANLIRDYYMKYYDNESNCVLDYQRDSEPHGLLAIALGIIRKLF